MYSTHNYSHHGCGSARMFKDDPLEEFEEKLRVQKENHSKEIQALKDFFALQLAAKDDEIAALKAKNG